MSGDDAQPYQRVMREIQDAIRLGRLRPGDRLPAAREMAERVGVAVNTVQRAYSELRLAGVIYSQQGRGTFVSETAAAAMETDATSTERVTALEAHVRRLDERLRRLEACNADSESKIE